MKKVCPICGSKEFERRPDDPKAASRGYRRACLKCGREYLVPRPDFVNGGAAYLTALIIMSFVLIDWFAPPRDLPFHFTWYGRVAVLGCSVFLCSIGTMLLAGKSWRL